MRHPTSISLTPQPASDLLRQTPVWHHYPAVETGQSLQPLYGYNTDVSSKLTSRVNEYKCAMARELVSEEEPHMQALSLYKFHLVDTESVVTMKVLNGCFPSNNVYELMQAATARQMSNCIEKLESQSLKHSTKSVWFCVKRVNVSEIEVQSVNISVLKEPIRSRSPLFTLSNHIMMNRVIREEQTIPWSSMIVNQYSGPADIRTVPPYAHSPTMFRVCGYFKEPRITEARNPGDWLSMNRI